MPRAIDVQLRDLSSALVPARHQEPDVIEAVVVVQVREEDVGHMHRLHPGLEQPMVGARAEVEQDLADPGLYQVARAHALERRRRRAGAEQPDAHQAAAFSRAESTARMTRRASSRSAPASGSRGPRTRSFPMPTSCWMSLRY